jgi:enoyl-CoA hydratase/carnithine racemase
VISYIQVENRDEVVLLQLNRSVTNAIDLNLVNELGGVLEGLRDDPDVRGIVLGSAEDKFFSIGFDIPQLYGLKIEWLRVFYQRFNQVCMDLYTLPKPTVGALTGHAIAGGCILALCCDYRIIAKGRKLMGLNELKLGVPVPYIADCILHQLVGSRIARQVIDTGEFFPSDQLLQFGLVDRVCPLDEVRSMAIEKARVVGANPLQAFAVNKGNRTAEVEALVEANLECREEAFIECWYSDQGRERLRAAMEKF